MTSSGRFNIILKAIYVVTFAVLIVVWQLTVQGKFKVRLYGLTVLT